VEFATRQYKDLILRHGHPNLPKDRFPFAKEMLDASADCIKVISLNGDLLTMNRAGCLALGIPIESNFGMPWLPLLPDSIREAGSEAIAEARQGRSARFSGMSAHTDGTRYWDNLLTPITDDEGHVQLILCVSRDVTTKTLLERELENTLKREKLLAQEMRHRIKNVFAVVSSLVFLSEKEAARNGLGEAVFLRRVRNQLASFARSSDVLFEPGIVGSTDEDRVDVARIVGSVLLPFATRYRTKSGSCVIPRRSIMVVAMFLHELATNSMKYGAFSSDGGSVQIDWISDGSDFSLIWKESGGPPVLTEPQKLGFGSNLIDRTTQSVGGTVSKTWAPEGLIAKLRMPVL